MTVETVIANGTLVTEHGTREGALAIDEGRIVAVGKRDRLPVADTVVDATGQLVMPGVVDPHVHVGDHVSLDTYETASKAAALGGVTTFIDFAWQGFDGDAGPDPEVSLLEGIADKRSRAAASVVDFGLHAGLLREDPAAFDSFPDLVEAGVTSVKMYTAYEFGLSHGFIRRALDRLADHGIVALFHTEDDSICEALTEELRAAGRTDERWYPRSRPDYTEAIAANAAARIAREVGAKYYGVHTSCEEAADVLAAHRDDGTRIRAETCTHYTALTDERYESDGALPRIAPPLRTAADRDALFEHLRRGSLQVVSTDHVAQSAATKTASNWWEGPYGANGLQRSLQVFQDEAVAERGLSYPFVVRVMCANPARTFGLPNKGTLDPGTDADIVLFDPTASDEITAGENASVADYSLYEGRQVTGRVTKTFVRGELVADDGAVVGTPGHGRFVERTVPEWTA
ncbi:dihydroorotase [Salinigranum marinum]|uniref:dihydroorotase n=1 Tax=Salinigranum marinum TaxID=1515595 RepID=UPI002989B809|nr:amidohydrolase family protein [Salinigranum marinum]